MKSKISFLRKRPLVVVLIVCLLMAAVSFIEVIWSLETYKEDRIMDGRQDRHEADGRVGESIPPNRRSACVFKHGNVVEMQQKSIVYIKMIKCASTSLANLINRFAYKHELEVVFPVDDKIYIGWPYAPKRKHILETSRGKLYQVATNHVVYDRRFFDPLMTPNTSYITSLRHPYSQMKSMVNYYNVLNISRVPSHLAAAERFGHYILNLEHYDTIYKLPESSQLRHCVPNGFSMTRNLMSFNLGFPYLAGFNDKLASHTQVQTSSKTNNEDDTKTTREYSEVLKTYIDRQLLEKSLLLPELKEWLEKLRKEMDLVLIVEWLPESLMLMKRKFCWSMEDVLVINANSLDYKFRVMEKLKDVKLEKIYEAWSWVDYELYDYFNKTLWVQLDAQPVSFWSEVERLKEITGEVLAFCSEKRQGLRKLTIEKSKWNEGFEVDVEFCDLDASKGLNAKLKDRYGDRLRSRGVSSVARVESEERFC